MFDVLLFLKERLPVISGITWRPSWPQDFASLPRGCFRLANNVSGILTGSGERSAIVSGYVDVWAKTPEDRQSYAALIDEVLLSAGMVRRMQRDVEETLPSGLMAYRTTLLYECEVDFGTQRICAI